MAATAMAGRTQTSPYGCPDPAKGALAATKVVPPRVVKRVRPASRFSRCPPKAGILPFTPSDGIDYFFKASRAVVKEVSFIMEAVGAATLRGAGK
jgi:hypothetical protein